MGCKEESKGVKVVERGKHHGMTTYSALEERKKSRSACRRDGWMMSKPLVSEAEATICLPVKMRSTRLHSRRVEELPPVSPCGSV